MEASNDFICYLILFIQLTSYGQKTTSCKVVVLKAVKWCNILWKASLYYQINKHKLICKKGASMMIHLK